MLPQEISRSQHLIKNLHVQDSLVSERARNRERVAGRLAPNLREQENYSLLSVLALGLSLPSHVLSTGSVSRPTGVLSAAALFES